MKKLLAKLQIHSMNDFFSFMVQFIKFGLVGLSNTLISLIIYYIFVYFNPKLYLLGNFVGFVVGMLNSFFWNNRYVFKKSEGGNLKPFVKMFAVYGSTFLLGSLLLFIMVDIMKISTWLAPLINFAVTVPLNFLLNKYWAFK